jgi:YbgC/YbaW family acyl-CoA thioester hydrolase
MSILDTSRSYATETKSRTIIRFQDCDPLQHLNNAKYFDYFFNAREDQVPKLYGVEVRDLIARFKAVWVVYNHHIAYLRSAMLGEWVSIRTRLIWHDDNTLVIEYLMLDEEETHLKTVLWTTLKYVSMESSRTTTHPPEVVEYLDIIQHKGVEYRSDRFDDRVIELKEGVKNGF